MTTLTLLPVDPAVHADAVLDNACRLAVEFIRRGMPETARLVLDRAQRYVAAMLGGGL